MFVEVDQDKEHEERLDAIETDFMVMERREKVIGAVYEVHHPGKGGGGATYRVGEDSSS